MANFQCKKEIQDEDKNVLFYVGSIYEEYDDRGGDDELGWCICLLNNLKRKSYLWGEYITECFEEINVN